MLKNKIKEIRKANGDTLKDLAQKLNYDYSNLSKIERGIYNASLPLIKKIANVYSMDVAYFINDENNCSSEEENFIKELNLNSNDLKQKYDFVLDGEKLSEQELDFMIDMVRKLRTVIDSNN
ncbi:helix-turn-helix domain-containing protein [Priestia megaterium]|uniref:helix-turn-helix domain-containing protein n=1 Tax=Priestia megaterium TaxID=1404 RepID=UPI000BFC88C8|nr:helix-turn-helix domain-containing protein [Priestia megaterium]PGX77760.1 transcriptional regulator [Priestia megaterium]